MFEEPKPMTMLNSNKDNNDHNNIQAWAQAQGVHVIPDEDEDDAMALPAKLNEEEDEDAAVNADNNEVVVQPKPAKKTLCAMCQLAMFYNTMATNYIQGADSNNDTVATSNQLGRQGADVTNPDPEVDLDMSSKTHGLKEDSLFNSDMSLKRHVPQEDMSDEDQASAAIDYLPNFAFYSRNLLLVPK